MLFRSQPVAGYTPLRPQSGGVIQVVSGTFTNSGTTTSTSYVAQGASLSITPKFATSKIFISVVIPAWVNASGQYCQLTIYRNGTTNLSGSFGCMSVVGGPNTYDTGIPIQYLDSPATTSSTSYAIYFKSASGGSVAAGETSFCGTYMTLMEIAA